MSFKGFKKTLVRAPQNFRQKMNMGEVTLDPVYLDAERRFKELEIETKKLSDESKRYFASVNGMLDFQIEFSKAIEEIYKPISGRLSDPNAAVAEDNPEGIKASEQYREVVKELKDTLKPDLELIEKRIVNPAQELLKVIALIRKMATKREHKQVDLDRHKRNYKKYEDKKERTAKDEEKMYSAEAEVAIAQQEYDYFNDMLKNELPVLFQMQLEFIRPLFVSFYYMQLNIFYTLYNRMEELKIPYFDLSLDIVEAYHAKKGNIEEQTDSIGITNFKVGHAKNKLEATKRRHQLMNAGLPQPGAPGAGQLPAYTTGQGQYGQYGQYGNEKQEYAGQQQASAIPATTTPSYGQYGSYGQPSQVGGYPAPQSPATTGYSAPAVGAGAVATPVGGVPPPAYQSGGETCTALYDYTAQAQGDLTFPTGAVIQVVERGDANGWWTGSYNGQTGSFPGNYVQMN